MQVNLRKLPISAQENRLSPDLRHFVRKLDRSINGVERWVVTHQYRGYDPADGNSSFLHRLTFGNLFLQRVLQQVVLRSPWNIRPLLGITPLESPQARAYMTRGYITLYQQTGSDTYKQKAVECLHWLTQNHSPRYPQYCWGYLFNYATRGGKRAPEEPTIVWTSLIGQAFCDAFEVFQDERYLEVVRSICDWILALPREYTATGDCISYVAYKQSSIHNSNMLGGGLLARFGSITGDDTALRAARESMRYSCLRMKNDGGWLYGEEPKYHWFDNFHTGYNLENLRTYAVRTGNNEFEQYLHRGMDFFKKNFIEEDGSPKYFHNKKYPIDIQSASQTIETLTLLSEIDTECFALARKVANWTIDNMQDTDGHFYYRDLGGKKVTVPMIHWAQATMFKAMVQLLARIQNEF